jgi:WD40 repeat protein
VETTGFAISALVWGQRYHPAFERTMIFLEYSRKEFETEQRIKELEAKRKLQRARTTAIVLGSFLIVALIAVVYAFVQTVKAQAAERQAQAEKAIADEQRKQAEAAKAEADRQAKIAEERRVEAEAAKERALASEAEAKKQQKLAEEAKKRADASALEAKRQEAKALESAAEARKQEALARQAQANAEKLRYQAIAKAMGLKSVELIDPSQKAAVAQQAYNFNAKYGGYVYENDIYGGLVRALADNKDPLTASLEGHKDGAVRDLETKKGSSHIYSAGSDGKILRWSHNPTDQKWSYETVIDAPAEGRGYQVYSIDISDDETLLVAGGLNTASPDRTENYVELYDLNNMGSSPKKIPGFVHDIENLHFAPDGKGFYARDNAGLSIKFCDLSTVREVIKPGDKVNAIDLSPDGTKLAGGDAKGNLLIWDIQNNYKLTSYLVNPKTSTIDRVDRSIDAVAFSPDGKSIIVGTNSGVVKIWKNGTTTDLVGHKSSISQIRFNHTGKFMATSSFDRSMRLWNMEDLNKQPIVVSESEWVNAMAFTPDDQQIMAGMHAVATTAEGDVFHPIRVWPTDIERMKNILCDKYVKENLSQNDWERFTAVDIPREKTCPNKPYPENK